MIDGRRSQRVRISVDVVLTWKEPDGKLASEKTKTLVLNAHGALLLLRKPVKVKDLLTIKNPVTGDELECRVVSVSAAEPSGEAKVGVDFIKQAPRFWRIAFPPSDWSIHSPEAKCH